MQIEFTKEQFKEMLLATAVYSFIFGGVADSKGEDFKKYGKLENYLLSIAKKNNLNDLYEDCEGSLLPADDICHEVEETIEEYTEDEFWENLVTRLGKRDFWRSLSEEEKEEIKKDDWLPEKVREFYDKYWEEVENYDIDRLEVKE
ncbi:hypothetical protein ACFL23_02940 [Patescibacteria group bacterium]